MKRLAIPTSLGATAVALVLIFATLRLGSDSASSADVPILYLSNQPALDAARMEQHNIEATSLEAAQSVDFDHTWAVLVDRSSLSAVGPGFLSQAYRNGVAVLGLDIPAAELAAAADVHGAGIADIGENGQDPLAAMDLSRLSLNFDGPYLSLVVRTSQSVYADTGCMLAKATHMELGGWRIDRVLANARGIAQALTHNPDGSTSLACGPLPDPRS